MIQSRPKSSLLISIGFILVCLVVADGWLFYSLLRHPDQFFWWKLVLTPTLLVIAIAIARKGYQSTLQFSIGNNQLTYRYLFGRSRTHKISEVKSWHEETVNGKKVAYQRVTILLANGRVLQLSNQENSQYPKVVSYLKKRVKK